ncbi:hypothetical protein K3495_g282 [Podosphaera aphanis]|nr:hypothetical protein K3495_g282 [Podosphaera aphanis]
MFLQPDLPKVPHYSADSILARRFGRETANYFSGSPLNRVSFLRTNHAFIGAALTHPSAIFLCLKNLAPLAHDPSKLAFVSHDQVKGLIGQNPFEKSEEEMIRDYDSSITTPLLLFLGLDEHQQDGFEYAMYKGKPCFAIDITPKGSFEVESMSVIEALQSQGLDFLEGRIHSMLNAYEAAIYAQARSLMDWNARNPYCAGCGCTTLSVNAGAKRTCPPRDLALPPGQEERPACITRKGISNLCFPRTDPTVIAAVISHSGDRILLGRQKRWPVHMYSTLAGFIEPGESVEEAVRREVWEESGVSLGQVVLHSTQSWPYPASLMIGAISQSLPDGEKINLRHDPELEDAQWFTVHEVRKALAASTNVFREEPTDESLEVNLKLPPKTAIAHQLLRALIEEISLEESKI